MSLWNPQDVPPYPPTRYTKDRPEVSAWVRRGDAAPDYQTHGVGKETYLAAQVKYHYLADQEQTGGDYVLYRVELGPAIELIDDLDAPLGRGLIRPASTKR